MRMMAKATILAVDDEEDIRELVKLSLAREGYEVLTCETGEQALQTACIRLPTLVILDIMLPGIDGLEVCKRLKRDPRTQYLPVVMLTAKAAEADIVTGLELGADNYVTKPFSGKVLVARVRRILSRTRERTDDRMPVVIHDLTIDPAPRKVLIGDKAVEPTFTGFNMLHTLPRRPGLVSTRYQIVDALHGDECGAR